MKSDTGEGAAEQSARRHERGNEGGHDRGHHRGHDRGFDELDRQLVHALQLDARAPFSRIGEVLGVSDQTVARRYTRLRSTGAIRVLGLTEPELLGEVVWMVRVQCTPDAATSVAEALARRPDTAWVSMLSGGTEIAAVTRAASDQDSDALLLRTLPSTPRVVGVTAHLLLHTFFGGAQSLVSKSGTLSADQVARLTGDGDGDGNGDGGGDGFGTRRGAGHVRASAAGGPLTAGDQRMLAELARDGRARPADLAAVTGWSQSTVRRRMAELLADGTLYFDVDYDHRIFGLGVTALLYLSVPPSELVATGEALATHPEVGFACATTGPHNLLASVVCADVRSLYTYVTTRVAALPAVQSMETAPRIRTVKGPGPFPVPPHARRPHA